MMNGELGDRWLVIGLMPEPSLPQVVKISRVLYWTDPVRQQKSSTEM
jgi:hypothetical protein